MHPDEVSFFGPPTTLLALLQKYKEVFNQKEKLRQEWNCALTATMPALSRRDFNYEFDVLDIRCRDIAIDIANHLAGCGT